MDIVNSIWTRSEIIEAIKPLEMKGGDFYSSGCSIDSRTIKSGEIFIALSGQNFDGHIFIQKSISNGASAVIIDNAEYFDKFDFPTILVRDCELALNQLAHYRRNQSTGNFIAITGSVGKTSTKEALYFILRNFGKTFATQGNYNNHLGVPLSIANMHRNCDYGIFEIGTSNPGEILPLSKLVRPDIAILTAIAPAHLQNFKSVDEIAEEKLSIIGGLSKDGILFYNGETCGDYTKTLATAHENYTRFLDINGYVNFDSPYLSLAFINKNYQFPNLQPSPIVAQTIHCVLSISQYLGFDLKIVGSLLNDLKMPKGRGRHSQLSVEDPKNLGQYYQIDLIDDSYNANPLSMIESIKFATNYAKRTEKKLVLILGDMLELGQNEIKFHEELESYIDSSVTSWLIAVGDLMNYLSAKVKNRIKTENFRSSDEIIKNIFDIIDKNSVVLIKGSHSTGLYRLVDDLLKYETLTSKLGEDKNAV